MECDFCSSQDVVRRYECMDFNSSSSDIGVYMPTKLGPRTDLTLKSVNYWAACQPCAELIDKEDLKGLLDRVIVVFSARGYKITVGQAKHFAHTYRLFFDNRIRVIE